MWDGATATSRLGCGSGIKIGEIILVVFPVGVELLKVNEIFKNLKINHASDWLPVNNLQTLYLSTVKDAY